MHFSGEEEEILKVITSEELKKLGHVAVGKTMREDEVHGKLLYRIY